MNVNLFNKVYGLAETQRQLTETNKQWSDKTSCSAQLVLAAVQLLATLGFKHKLGEI